MTDRLCLDFDGVIHSYTTEWQGATTIPDPPTPGAFEWIEKALDKYKIAVYSSRSKEKGGIGAMKAWFIKHGMDQFTLNNLEFPTEKPAAHIYLDDRGWKFEGVWPSLDEIAAFKTWTETQ